jgi:adenylate cyclase
MKRQLAAILYADVVGYSRLTDLDEEKTLQSLRSNMDLFTSKIGTYNGQKIKEAGDAILAEFASAIDSVNCAIEFQSEMATLNLEVGDGDKFEFRKRASRRALSRSIKACNPSRTSATFSLNPVIRWASANN